MTPTCWYARWRDDATQALAADPAIAKGAWVSHRVLAETAGVLDAVHARKAKQLIAALELLVRHESLVLQDADVVGTVPVHCGARPAVGFL